MKSEFRKTVEKLTRSSAELNTDGTVAVYAKCNDCGEERNVRTLAQHGGKCLRCYDAYCALGAGGSAKGYAEGVSDTPQQADMRKRLRVERPAGNLPLAPRSAEGAPSDEQARRDMQRRVAEYARERGIDLARDQSPARAFSGEVPR